MSQPSDGAALASLAQQGYEIGEQVTHPSGVVKVGIRSKDESAWVELGNQLWDLAGGRITLAKIREGPPPARAYEEFAQGEGSGGADGGGSNPSFLPG